MRKHSIRIAVACLAAGALTLPLLAPAQGSGGKKRLSVDDLYRLDTATQTALTPDGRRAVFIRQWVDPDRKVDRYSLWLAEGSSSQIRQVEPGEPDARAPVFSPDNKWLAFVSTRPRPEGWKQTPPVPPESDPATDIWLLSTQGGAAFPLSGEFKPYGRVFNDGFYGRLAFSPDGRNLAFIADDGADPRSPQEVRDDVTVVRPDQGEGYTGYRPAQLWVAHLDERPTSYASSRIDRLTRDDVWYGDPQWSPDGRTIAVHANRTPDRESVRYSINRNFDIWTVDAASGEIRQVTRGEGPEVSPRYSPDGKRLACLSVPRRGSHRDAFNLAVVDLTGPQPQFRVVFDQHGKDADRPPHPAPSFPLPNECWDDEGHVVINADLGTGTQVLRVDVNTGRSEPLPAAPQGEGPEALMKSFAGRLALRQQYTPPGNAFLAERELAPTKVVTWKNDGQTIEGVLTTPPPGAGKQPYKLVAYPHGGPHSRSAIGFDFTNQVLAANGYAVLQPNFRGSSGYGQKFIDADRADFGGGDMRDILAGVDQLITEGVADQDRLFIYGVSYGGYMACWMVGHTDRFRAAVAQNAVTDLDMMWGLSDLQSWTEWEFGGKPWEVAERMRKHSPLTYADKIKTPTLILHARDDRRCPMPMGRAFYQALVSRGVDTEMVIYPNEGHAIRQPRHREDVLLRLLDWFGKHDKK